MSASSVDHGFEWRVGWRYTRTGRGTRRNGFISFISGASMLGIMLGVAALIVVLSVMNGFRHEVAERMLSVISHLEVSAPPGDSLPDPAQTIAELRTNAHVVGAAPFIAAQGLLVLGDRMKGVLLRGVDPALEAQVTDLAAAMPQELGKLSAGDFSIILGSDLARSLGAGVGSQVTLTVPSGQLTPAGFVPRMKQMTVVGIFNSGHYEYDAALAMVHVDDAAKLFRLENATGIRVKLDRADLAQQVAYELADTLHGDYILTDWTRQNRSWFAAVQLEKRMMFIILTLIVAVAAFNLVSTLVMTVQDKQSDIAVLRTLGATPRSIMKIFMVQGAIIGVLGTFGGLALGLLIACNIDVIVPFLERVFHADFLPKDIYLINRMPSDPQAGDIVPIVITSLILSLLATIYPSRRAGRVHPAQALRYE